MKKIFVYLSLGMLMTTFAQAQQALQEQNTYLIMPFGLSPSYSGLSSGTELGISYRNHWTGVANAPARVGLLASSSLGEKVGIGVVASNFSGGIFNQNNVALNYTYHIPLSDQNKLSMSMQLAYMESSINSNHANVDFSSDPLLMARVGLRQSLFNAGASAMFSSPALEVGVYSPNLFRNTSQNENTYQLNIDQTLLGPAVLLHAGWKKEMSDGSMLRITGIGRSQRAIPMNYEASMSYHIKQMVLLGASIRQQGLLGFHGGYTAPSMRFLYSYELPGNSISGQMAQTHEVNLVFILGGNGDLETEKSGKSKKSSQQVDDNTERIEKLNNNLQYQSDNFKEYQEVTDDRLKRLEDGMVSKPAPEEPKPTESSKKNLSTAEMIHQLVQTHEAMNKAGISPKEKGELKAKYDKEAKEVNAALKTENKRLELIAGAFGVEANAKKVSDELNAKGIKSTVFLRSDKKLYYISAGTNTDIMKAIEQKASLNKKGTYTWIYIR